MDVKTFLDEFESYYSAKYKEIAEYHWLLNVTGKKEYEEKVAEAEKELVEYFADKERFETVKKFYEEREKYDDLTKRRITLLYKEFLGSQGDVERLKKMVNMSVELSSIFNNFRANVDGKKVTDNEIKEVLLKSTDNAEREKYWYAAKQIAKEIEPKLKELIKLRNEHAKDLGYKNYYELAFEMQELDLGEIISIFDELKKLTDEPFRKMKDALDEELSKKFNIPKENLMPWHYADPFFQDAPPREDLDLTPFYKDKDIVELTVKFYESIGFDIKDLIEKADLYEKEGKCQHAFCLDVDRKGDVRVLCNVKPTESWMDTMLHEFGHAIYDKYTDYELPFDLRGPAHTFTTEAIAMLFGRLSKNMYFLKEIVGVDENTAKEIAEKAKAYLALQLMITARWVMRFVKFEQALYMNPDNTDLNQYWWDLAREYQYLKSPKESSTYPYWASKIHFSIAPVYYHNYLLGEMMASQLDYYIKNNVIKDENYIGRKEISSYLIEKVFKPAKKYHWNEMLKYATGEYLNPKYFIKQTVEEEKHIEK